MFDPAVASVGPPEVRSGWSGDPRPPTKARQGRIDGRWVRTGLAAAREPAAQWHDWPVQLSRRSEYALRTLVDLVRHAPDGPVPLAVLAARNNLPVKFLEQIMAILKHAGIVRATLGAHGGYALGADPDRVTIGRIVRLLDGALAPVGCVSLRYYEPCSCPDEATCALRDVMIDVRDAILEILDNETLSELARRRGQASIDPRGIHADALAGRRP
jgi:Rrf2 family protein